MNKAWLTTTIGSLVDKGTVAIQTGPFGSQLHSYDYEPSGVPVILTESIGRRRLITVGNPKVSLATANRLSRHMVRSGDILFARRGAQATGLSALVEDEHSGWLCGSGAILLRIYDSSLDPIYLSFALSTDTAINWLKQHAVGAVMPNINETVIRGLPILLPPYPEQVAIANILKPLDDKIELNRRIETNIIALIRSLFKAWFSGILSREVPVGWRVVNLGDESAFPLVQPGVEFDEYEKVHYIATGDVRDGTIINETEGYYRELPARANMKPGKGRIWFAKMKDSRKYLWTMEEDDEWWRSRVLSTGFSGIQTRNKTYESYLYSYITSDEFDEEKIRLATGTTMQAVNTDAINSIRIVFPPETVVEKYDHVVRPMYRKIWQGFFESRTLASLRDILLPKLMRGEVRVQDVN